LEVILSLIPATYLYRFIYRARVSAICGMRNAQDGPLLTSFVLISLHQIIVVIFACDPIEAQWNITIADKTCISFGAVYITGSTPNVVTDLLILLMPVPYVWRLHAPVSQRLILVGMFMLACFVSIVSIMRLTILVGIPFASSDVTYNTKKVIVWSIVEINIGLMCACFPSMKQALNILHLDKLIPGSTGRQHKKNLDPNIHAPTIGKRSGRSRGGVGGISGRFLASLVGLTRLKDEEDGFQMINNAYERYKKSMPQNGAIESHTVDTDNES
jgi:hypothetical protein